MTIYYITQQALETANRIRQAIKDAKVRHFNPKELKGLWSSEDSFLFIMAVGIVVRTIAPLLQDKTKDPAVIVIDELGKHVISLTGGHLGGANKLTREIAQILDADPIVTTSTDINHLTAIDLWLREKGLVLENPQLLPLVTSRFISNGTLRVFVDEGLRIELPADFLLVSPSFADLIITNRIDLGICGCRVKDQLVARPKNLYLGIGCNSGTTVEEIEEAVKGVFLRANLSLLSISKIATIDLKTKERGLSEFAKKLSLPLVGFSAQRLNGVEGIKPSEAVERATGAKAVAEPASILASGGGELIVKKTKSGNLTIAVAEVKDLSRPKAILSVVGIGPGDPLHMTPVAKRALVDAELVVGYDTYIDQIRSLIYDKPIYSTGMTAEVDRCTKAVEMALSGKNVVVVSGGDPGIYGMAGLVLEILKNANESGQNYKVNPHDLELEIIPGLTALNACASRLGAPLMHDFATISLSDRLTDWQAIEKRLHSAAEADFVIVLYNPKSKGRVEHIHRAREILLSYRSPDTPVGIVRSAMREHEEVVVTSLKEMLDYHIDMQSTVIIGNSKTYVWNNWIITPRGYEAKIQR